MISILKSLSEIKPVDASDCGQISVEQARDILYNCKRLEFFSFFPSWGSSDLWPHLLSHFKHVKFGDPISFLYEEEELY